MKQDGVPQAGGSGRWGRVIDLVRGGAQDLADTIGEVAEEINGADEVVKKYKENAGLISLAATAIEIFAVAGGVIALVSGIISGAAVAGALGFTACVLCAIIANDVRVMANTINSGGIHNIARILVSNNPNESICVAAAKKGTVILRPDLVRWAFSPFHN